MELKNDKAKDESNYVRPLARVLAREISAEEVKIVSGGDQTGCTVYGATHFDTDKQF